MMSSGLGNELLPARKLRLKCLGMLGAGWAAAAAHSLCAAAHLCRNPDKVLADSRSPAVSLACETRSFPK